MEMWIRDRSDSTILGLPGDASFGYFLELVSFIDSGLAWS
jgi:hypothetical protein